MLQSQPRRGLVRQKLVRLRPWRGSHRSQTAWSKASLHMVWASTYENYTDDGHSHGVDG